MLDFFSFLSSFLSQQTPKKMLKTLLSVSLLAALALPAAAQKQSDDEFSMLNIPRPGALLSGFGMPMNLGKLLAEMDGGDEEAAPSGATRVHVMPMNIDKLLAEMESEKSASAPSATRVHVIRLPPALSGLFRSIGEPQKEAARPTMTMRFGPIAMPMRMHEVAPVSRPLAQLRTLASNCVPCSQIQSHMSQISIMHGAAGQTVKTVTEVLFSCHCSVYMYTCMHACQVASFITNYTTFISCKPRFAPYTFCTAAALRQPPPVPLYSTILLLTLQRCASNRLARTVRSTRRAP